MSLVKKITKAVAGNPLDNAEEAHLKAVKSCEEQEKRHNQANDNAEAAAAAIAEARSQGADSAALVLLYKAEEDAKRLLKVETDGLDHCRKQVEAEAKALEQARAKADEAKKKAIADTVSATLLDRTARIYRETLELVRDVCESQARIDSLGGGLSAEEARRKSWLSETVVRDEVVELVCDLRGQPLDPQPRRSEIVSGDGGKYITAGSGRHADRTSVQLRNFRKVALLEGLVRHQIEPFYRGIALPGLMSDDWPLWRPEDGRGDPEQVANRAHEALKRLAAQLRAAREKHDDRRPVERLIPVDPRPGEEPGA